MVTDAALVDAMQHGAPSFRAQRGPHPLPFSGVPAA
jgi:hypothetical protein